MLYSIGKTVLDYSNTSNYNDTLFHSLKDRISHNQQLVLFVPEEPCTPCVRSELDNLKNMPEYIRENTILITQFLKRRDIKIWQEKEGADIPIYNANNLFLEKLGANRQMALFLLDSTLQPRHLFIPISFMPELSDKYYKFVTDLLGGESEYKNDSTFVAKVALKESKHRFGKIKEGETVSTKFEIQNVSEIPFVIHKVETTCGCTVAEWEKNPIEKNESTSITVNFKADKIGFFTKKIFVFSNTKNSPQIFLISGNVVESSQKKDTK